MKRQDREMIAITETLPKFVAALERQIGEEDAAAVALNLLLDEKPDEWTQEIRHLLQTAQ